MSFAPTDDGGGFGGIFGGMSGQFMPALAIAFSTGLKAIGQIGQGNAMVDAAKRRQQAAGYEAEQLRVNAGQAQAASQHQAYWEGRKADVLASAMRARLGSGASDPTGLNLLAEVMSRRAYNMQSALYAGKDKARTLNATADAKEYDAALAVQDARAGRRTAYLAAAGTIASGGASLYEKYWPKDKVDFGGSSSGGGLAMDGFDYEDGASPIYDELSGRMHVARGPTSTTGIRG